MKEVITVRTVYGLGIGWGRMFFFEKLMKMWNCKM